MHALRAITPRHSNGRFACVALPCLTSQAKTAHSAPAGSDEGVNKSQQLTPPLPVCRSSPSGMRAFLLGWAWPSDLAGARDRARRVAKTRYSTAADMHVRVVCARLGCGAWRCARAVPARPRACMHVCRARAPSQERRNEGGEYVRVPHRFGTVIAPGGGSARTACCICMLVCS
jgi:hypothetical protein